MSIYFQLRVSEKTHKARPPALPSVCADLCLVITSALTGICPRVSLLKTTLCLVDFQWHKGHIYATDHTGRW